MLKFNCGCLCLEAAERQCPSHLPDTNTATAHALAQDLTVILYPIGRDKKFSLYVSWESNDRELDTYC